MGRGPGLYFVTASVPATARPFLAEEHRQHTERWYHDCGHDIHRQYAQEYLANDDGCTPGLGQYIHDAIIANCQRAASLRS